MSTMNECGIIILTTHLNSGATRGASDLWCSSNIGDVPEFLKQTTALGRKYHQHIGTKLLQESIQKEKTTKTSIKQLSDELDLVLQPANGLRVPILNKVYHEIASIEVSKTFALRIQ